MRVPALPLLLAAVLLLGSAGTARADRESAKFFAVRGERSLAERKWGEAEEHYRRALQEDGTFLQARHGLAQALLGAGRTADAVAELRTFVAEAEALPDPPSDVRLLRTRAEKQLGEIDASAVELERIAARFAGGLVELAKKWESKDRTLAEKALRNALAVKPGHPKAEEALKRLGLPSVRAISLFNGKDLDGWALHAPPYWQVKDGVIVGEVKDAGLSMRTDRMYDGDFDVRIEAQVLQVLASPYMFCLQTCWKDGYNAYHVGYADGHVTFFEKTVPEGRREILAPFVEDLKTPFDKQGWNLYEMRLRKGEVSTYVNGELLAKEPRASGREGGFLGLYIQNVRVAFRRLEVELK